MKEDVARYMTVGTVAVAFAGVSFLVWITRRHPYWVKKKLSIGALLLSLTAVTTGGCTSVHACYAPVPAHVSDSAKVSLSSPGVTGGSGLASAAKYLRLAGFEVGSMEREWLSARKRSTQGYESSVDIRSLQDGTVEIIAKTWADPKDSKARDCNRNILSDALQALTRAANGCEQ